jgi:hypothetical protein
MKLFFSGILSVLVIACSSSPSTLTDEGKKVEVFDTKPGSECSVVGKVVGINEQGSADMARNHARNLAANLRGNALFITQEVPNGQKVQVYATAYDCE